jgi:hypothetical protein
MLSRRSLVAVPAALALGAAAAPAAPAAGAVSLAPLAPCYVSVSRQERQTMDIRAAGFSPLSVVDVRIAGTTAAVDADAFGNVLTRPSAPFQRRGQRRFTVSLVEQGNPANAVVATTRVTDLSVTIGPSRNVAQRVPFRGRGFTLAQPIWAHYVFHGTLRRTVRFAARPRGACGRFSVRRPTIPVLLPRSGRWRVQFDQQREWSRRPNSVMVSYCIPVGDSRPCPRA